MPQSPPANTDMERDSVFHGGGLVAKLYPTLYHPCLDCSPPGFSVHRISPGKNTGVSCHFLLWIFPTQRSNLGLLHYRQFLYQLSHQGISWWCHLKKGRKDWSVKARWHLVIFNGLSPFFFLIVGT